MAVLYPTGSDRVVRRLDPITLARSRLPILA